MKTILFVIVVAVILVVLGIMIFKGEKTAVPEETPRVSDENSVAILHTTMGDIKIELFEDKTPITARNFVKLANEGFYDGTKFHRVIADFMIQGGDPNTRGDNVSVYGTGGPGYTIKDEFAEGLSNTRGTISMANTGLPDSGGSQFFINLVNNSFLDFDKQPSSSRHPVFGKVVEGMDVVDAVALVGTDEGGLPLEPVIIISVSVEIREEVWITEKGEPDVIKLFAPRAGEEVRSPLVVRGEARGFWFFEADFPVLLTNWDGLIIAEGFAAAKSDWATEDYVPFEAVLEFENPAFPGTDEEHFSRRGYLILKKNNPSGLPEYEDALEIPVIFGMSEQEIFCTMEWAPVCGVDGKTYSNRCVAEQQHKVQVAYEGQCLE